MANISINNLSLALTVRDRNGILYEGPVEAVTSFNDKGEFDVLPMHSYFISIIHKSLILRVKGGTTQTLSLETGILSVKNDKVDVYLGILSKT